MLGVLLLGGRVTRASPPSMYSAHVQTHKQAASRCEPASNPGYSVAVTERAVGPGGGSVVSKANKTSTFNYNCNPGYFPARRHELTSLPLFPQNGANIGFEMYFVPSTFTVPGPNGHYGPNGPNKTKTCLDIL